MANYTSGPLYIQGPSTGNARYDNGGDYAIYRLNEDGEKEIIGEAFRLVGEGVEVNAKANACLWASAPARLAAADALAEAGEKAENALMALIDDIQTEGFCSVTFGEYREGGACGDMTLGTARAALRELDSALRQYKEAANDDS